VTEPATGTDLRARTLADLIVARAEATPAAPMLFDERDREMTFAGYAAAVDDLAARFVARGVEPGSVVAWQLPTRIETVVVMGALARLGVTQVPVLPIHRERELRFMLEQSGAQWWCGPGTWRGYDFDALGARVQADLGTFAIIRCAPQPEADPDAVAAVSLPGPPGDGDGVRWIFYSSGTTAEPKGARITDRAAMASGLGMATAQRYRPDDRYGIAFPFTHIGGLTNLSAVLQRGFALILIDAFDPPVAVDVFARHQATIVGGGPAFYRAYLDQQRRRPGEPILPALRFMVGGGAPMPPAMHAEVRDEIGGRGCAHGYGMTESCSILALNDPDDTDDHLAHTVGRVVPGMEARVLGRSGVVAPPGEAGELQVRGAFLMEGYVDSSLDAEAFTADGWFRTGDLGSVDVDGYLRITGRTKDIIIRKGENISATELEDLLYTHPAVADVAVIGLPDDERGELACAVVVVAAGAPAPTLADLADHLTAAGLMRQKLPERVEYRATIPRNAAGKALKPQLASEYGQPHG
jgi:acyl-CoA synthetase (AMP-forming)/AMP-acid ligase II